MMDHSLLTDLCATCLSKTPIYRCPRCKAQTCSLSCYKRHQQRAACSGKRDPTAFVKKNQWATPAGIDHDYNYLKSVERSIDSASQNVDERGIGHEPQRPKVVTRAWQPGSALQQYLVENRITIQRAPTGMSRQKTNQTRETKSGSIMWSIEWADGAGKRAVQHHCHASSSLEAAYSLFQTERRNAEKRRRAHTNSEVEEHQAKKKRLQGRKVHERSDKQEPLPDTGSQNQINEQGSLHGTAPDHEGTHTLRQTDASSSKVVLAADKIEGEAVEQLRDSDQPLFSSPNRESEEHRDYLSVGSPSPVHFPHENNDIPEHNTTHNEASQKSKDYFYLLKPNTSGASHVLIPLDSDVALTECLRDQTVQEYPTIYVLTESPVELPAGFVLEKEYVKDKTAPTRALASADRVQKSANAQPDVGNKDVSEMDATSILNMLKRDVRL